MYQTKLFDEKRPLVIYQNNQINPLFINEVIQKRKIYGKNEIKVEVKKHWLFILINSLLDPFNILLIFTSFLSYIIDDIKTGVTMIFMVFISGIIRFALEYKSETILNNLSCLIKKKVTVIRKKILYEYEEKVDFEELVPGDFVKLSAGDCVAGDIQLIKSKHLFIDQSLLTGEIMPTFKYAAENDQIHIKTNFKINLIKNSSNKIDIILKWLQFYIPEYISFKLKIKKKKNSDIAFNTLQNINKQDFCFMGTSIVSGSGIGVIVAIGSNTYFGKMSEQIALKKPKTSFQKGVETISWIFILMILFIFPIVLILKGFNIFNNTNLKENIKERWIEAVQFALSVAVGLTPEMLPIVLLANLARSKVILSKRKCAVKRLESIVNLGSMNILCTDKTGTLTENYIELIHVFNYKKNNCSIGLALSYLNSIYQSGFKNLIDQAIINKYEITQNQIENNLINKKDNKSYNQTFCDKKLKKLNENPFDFKRRKVSILLEMINKKIKIIITKGAVNEMLPICSHVVNSNFEEQNDNHQSIENLLETLYQLSKKKDLILDKKKQANINLINNKQKTSNKFCSINLRKLDCNILKSLQDLNLELTNDGYRVLALAFKMEQISEVNCINCSNLDETDLIFVAFLVFVNTPKTSAYSALQTLIKNGVQIKVITGDTVEVSKNVCRQIGLETNSSLTSKQIENLSEIELGIASEKTVVFSQMTPIQKADIVKALKKRGFVVGFLGDGVNDAIALKESDVGISVHSATDIAKESADIVLLEKELNVINEGVLNGRMVFENTLKYICILMSASFGNVLSILLASMWIAFLPMAAIHILLQNLLYDLSQLTMAWDNVDQTAVLKPITFKTSTILYFMFTFGTLSTVFDVIAFIYLNYIFQNKSSLVIDFQTGWFTVGLSTQTLVLHILRTRQIPFFQSNASIIVYVSTITVLIVTLALPHSFCQNLLHLSSLPASFYFFLFILLIAYSLTIHAVKFLYIKKFNIWFT